MLATSRDVIRIGFGFAACFFIGRVGGAHFGPSGGELHAIGPLSKAPLVVQKPPTPADQAATALIDAYDILRRLRCDYRGLGRSREVIEEWTDRAVRLYRDGVKARSGGPALAAAERGLAALELARAVDHARNASRFEQFDPDLPDPPPNPHPRRNFNDIRRSLAGTRARIAVALAGATDEETAYYAGAARNLFNAARRDVERSGLDRGAELAMAAERMIAACEHVSRSLDPKLAQAGERARGEPALDPGAGGPEGAPAVGDQPAIPLPAAIE